MENGRGSRRDFLATVGISAAGLAVLAPVLGSDILAMSRSAPVVMEPITLDLTKGDYAALAKVGGAIKIPDPHKGKKPIIVVRASETQVAAFSSKCTHWGCEVSLPENGIMTCHCHNSTFDAGGKPLRGPAKKNLAPFSATLEGTVITIKEIPVE